MKYVSNGKRQGLGGGEKTSFSLSPSLNKSSLHSTDRLRPKDLSVHIPCRGLMRNAEQGMLQEQWAKQGLGGEDLVHSTSIYRAPGFQALF